MIHINNFIDKIKFFESKNSKDFTFTLSDAKNLHSDITKLLLALHQLQPKQTEILNKSTTSISGKDW